VMKLVSISMSRQMFNKELVHYGISSKDYWRQSAAVAAAMENLSDLLDEDRSYFFTLGILHAIGHVIIDHALKRRGSQVRWDKATPIEKWEVENFGFDYTDAGHVLLTAWNFPQRILAVILNQLTPERVNNPPNALLSLHFAIHWCKGHHYFREGNRPTVELAPWMVALEVTQGDLEELYEHAAKTYADLERMVGF
jgi:HD-like signal output (HDOD) protein